MNNIQVIEYSLIKFIKTIFDLKSWTSKVYFEAMVSNLIAIGHI
jgi:hypothetical protein